RQSVTSAAEEPIEEPPTRASAPDDDEQSPPSVLSNEAADETADGVSLETDAPPAADDPAELGEQGEEQSEPPPFATPRVFELDSIDEEEFDLEFGDANEPLSEVAPVIQSDLEMDAPEVPPHLETPETNSPDIGVAAKMATSKAAGAFRRKSPYGDYRQDDSTNDRWNSPTLNVDRAFQKLHLRDRFWQKLNLLTQDGYRQSLEVKKALDISDIRSDMRSEGNPQSNEFVVYDPPSYKSTQQTEQRPHPSANSDEVPRIQVLPPTLDVPSQELIAGDWVAIRVRVPVSDYQPYVKVWMNDLQTRTLIDAPRLLMQFTPNDDGDLETLMRIKVPTGCLELQFAAIAIDMSSLQESRKVVQNRRVMPPDDSLSIFDDWRM
ncbi:hypothetical protein IQ260_21915, partial [Leptolyngbya cf. ectocarpi LEGE 11479]